MTLVDSPHANEIGGLLNSIQGNAAFHPVCLPADAGQRTMPHKRIGVLYANRFPGPANTIEQQVQFGAQQALINQLSAIRPTGRIVVDMKPRSGGSS